MPQERDRTFQVDWHIDLIASSPEEAARLALALLQEPDTLQSTFVVTDTVTGKVSVVDAGRIFGRS
jgi:hypothetical protein